MKALIVAAPGQLQLIDADRPKAGPGDVLSRVVYSGICGTDLDILKGDISFVRDGWIKYPVRIGHEWSGIVEEVGENVKDFKPGDRVVSDSGVTCGVCPNCASGRYKQCEFSRSLGTVNAWDGSFAEYVLFPERHMHKLPDHVALEEAALVEPSTIALNGVKRSGVTAGSKVMIIGTGAIGLAAVTFAKLAGASVVLLSGRKDFKLDVGMKMGADAVVNVTKDNLREFVMQHTNGKGVDIIIETSGSIDTISTCLELLAPFGILSLISFYNTDLNGINIDKFVVSGFELRGVPGTGWMTQDVVDMLGAGKLDLKPLITHRCAFDDVIGTFRTFRQDNDRKIKTLVKISSEP
jgi:L-iditol 2-dehydrogenase